MYSGALDVNFGQQYQIVQRIKENCACFKVLFGNDLQSLIEL